MSKQTDKPFAQALEELLTEREWSSRELARQIDRLEDPTGSLSFPTIASLRRGDILPGLRAMALIAKVLKIRPEFFAEFRLDSKRTRLDWRHRGLRAALRELGE